MFKGRISERHNKVAMELLHRGIDSCLLKTDFNSFYGLKKYLELMKSQGDNIMMINFQFKRFLITLCSPLKKVLFYPTRTLHKKELEVKVTKK